MDNSKRQENYEGNINVDNSVNLPKKNLENDILEEFKSRTTLTKLLSQDLIVVSEDRLRLIYIEYIQSASIKQGWIAPAGLFTTMLLALLTSKFESFFGINASSWKSVFILGCFLSGVWLITAIFKSIKTKNIRDVDGFMNAIKEYEKELTNRCT